MTVDPSTETFTLAQIKQVAGGRDAQILEWAFAFKAEAMTDSVDGVQASILGAILAMKHRSRAKQGELRELLRDLVSYDGPSDEWLVVRRVRRRAEIEKPPIQIDVTSPSKARPVIYDPQTFLDDLRQLPD